MWRHRRRRPHASAQWAESGGRGSPCSGIWARSIARDGCRLVEYAGPPGRRLGRCGPRTRPAARLRSLGSPRRLPARPPPRRRTMDSWTDGLLGRWRSVCTGQGRWLIRIALLVLANSACTKGRAAAAGRLCATYYVSATTGSDSNSCARRDRQATPKQTILRWLCARAGDTVLLRGGSSTNKSSTTRAARRFALRHGDATDHD